jgi:hypothetical protein
MTNEKLRTDLKNNAEKRSYELNEKIVNIILLYVEEIVNDIKAIKKKKGRIKYDAI